MAKDSDFVVDSGETGGLSRSFSEVSLQNERAMWWAEFDSVGEVAVRDSVERNSYTPTGMEVARQWLARQEFLQLREDVKAIRALAEVAQETASASLTSASEALTLASAATATKNARTMVIVGMVVSLFALMWVITHVRGPPLSRRRRTAPCILKLSAKHVLPSVHGLTHVSTVRAIIFS